jgi:hypothetical protein
MKKVQKEYNKPLYYNEYIEENAENKNPKYNYLGLYLTLSFVFLFSISDIAYSYLEIDNCQTRDLSSLTLNNWLSVNGIFGICYSFFILLFLYSFFSEEKEKGYHLLVNKKNETYKTCETIYKSLVIFLTIIMLILCSVGCCIYFSFFNHYCQSYSIIIYMWIRLIIGMIISIFIIILIVLYREYNE